MDLSDEEKHALELRRERSNKVSRLMGDYLLKGYKMLGTTCNKCGTILMRDRQQTDYCVSCNDIDGAQPSMGIQAMSGIAHDMQAMRQTEQFHNTERNPSNRGGIQFSVSNTSSQTDEYRGVIKEVENSVLMKMQWASIQLRNCSLEDSLKWLQLINTCYDTLTRFQVSP
eukprot:Seg6720.1 transcript_id=Seg6720.1/GoldUCD/mRNA.D3Y31 product="Sjoegren syndrome/scleroderma autoantigen 1" protein_id=Seg6720.1/GoldUCD/D3Y31